MDELARRIRRANPYADRRLPGAGERILRDIRSGVRTAATEPTRSQRAESRPGRRRFPRPARIAAVAAAIAVVALVVAIAFERPTPAEAILPEPLSVTPASTTPAQLLAELRADPAPAADGSTPGYRLEGWYLQLDHEQTSQNFIQPQRVVVKTAADGSGVARVYAGTPVDAAQQPFDSLPDGAAEPGALLSEVRGEAGSHLAVFPTPPPDDAAAMRDYLGAYLDPDAAASANGATTLGAGDYAVAALTLLQTWTLGDAAQRAVVEVILSAAGAGVVGETIDRAGRAGLLLEFAPGPFQAEGSREQIVIDAQRWRILAAETIAVDGFPEYAIPPGSVTSYTLWPSAVSSRR